jgi:outer membrane receptor protein involved in Fe transport
MAMCLTHINHCWYLRSVIACKHDQCIVSNTQIFQREVNLVNASMMLQMSNGFEVGAWARNLLNDEYLITVFDGVAQAGTVSGYPNQPRTYGGIIRYRF